MKLLIFLPTYFAIATNSVSNKRIGDDCEWFDGIEGQHLDCMPGWTAHGACTSGRRNDCQSRVLSTKFSSQVKCCPNKNKNTENYVYHEQGHNYGVEATCDVADDTSNNVWPVSGICASSNKAGCKFDGQNHFIAFTCVENNDIETEAIDKCAWIYGKYGVQLECPDNYVMSGLCGSGGKGDCRDGTFTGIFCCPYSDIRGPRK